MTAESLRQRDNLQASPEPVFCDEQYDCVKPVFCAVARAAKEKAAIAANMLGEIFLIIKTVAAVCTVGG